MSEAKNFSPWIRYDLDQWGSLLNPNYLVSLKGKTIVYNQEEDISHIYIVKRGRVRLSYFTSEGAEKIYIFALAGAMFGEETCFEPDAQFLHAATIVDCELYCIPKEDFLCLLSQDPELNAQVLSSMAHKIHLLMEQVRRLCFLEAPNRVAAVFVDLAQVFGVKTPEGIRIELPVIQQGIANLVRTSRLTVNKAIGVFEAQGLLKKTQGRWMIYDLDALKALSDINQRRQT